MRKAALALIPGLALAVALLSAPKKPAPPADLTLTTMNGARAHLRDLRGKVVVLNLWATWCLPCREEMPMLVEAERVWAPKGVTFIAASLDDRKTKDQIPAFVNEFHVNFPVWVGATIDDLDKLRLGNAAPVTAFLDTDGVIFARVRGEIRREELDERLLWVTGGKSGTVPATLVTHLDQ